MRPDYDAGHNVNKVLVLRTYYERSVRCLRRSAETHTSCMRARMAANEQDAPAPVFVPGPIPARMSFAGGPSVWLEFSPLARLCDAVNLGQGMRPCAHRSCCMKTGAETSRVVRLVKQLWGGWCTLLFNSLTITLQVFPTIHRRRLSRRLPGIASLTPTYSSTLGRRHVLDYFSCCDLALFSGSRAARVFLVRGAFLRMHLIVRSF